MADNIIKLRVDSNEYEGKIKRASEGLQALGRSLRDAGKTFADADAKQVEFTRELGKMQTVSNTAKGKVAEMSAAFVNLKSQYLQMTDAERQSPIGQAMSKSLEQLKTRTIEAKRELESLNKELNETKIADVGGKGGGLFGGSKLGGMLQVFGGNLMTKAAGMAAGMAAGLATEIGDAVKQGIELAKQGEGIRIAFERLGRGDILDGLREATHGTVTDIELMKAAVKFNDFKLPIEELGTMLAFAQQKAKDTGQSVDYMVDSIVTGLGRKSLMILDNLGLSAAEIKEKMAETGDMTKAVGAIIREQMAKAGDYVETAADRAAQANVNLQNKMEELGRKFSPLQEASNNFWTSMKIGILDIVGGPLTRLLNGLTEAGRLQNMLKNMNGEPGSGNTKVDQQLKKLNVIKKGGGSNYIFNSTLNGMMEDYNRQIIELDKKIKNGGKWEGEKKGFYHYEDVDILQRRMDALKVMRDQLQAGAKDMNKPIKIESNIPDVTGGGRGKGGGKTGTVIDYAPDSIKAQQAEVQRLTSLWQKSGAAVRDDYKKQLEQAQIILDRMTGAQTFDPSKLTKLQGVSVAPNTALPDLKWADISKQKQEIQAELKVQQVKVDEETLKTMMKDAVQNGINGMDFQFAILGEKIGRGIDVPDSEWQKIVDEYNKMREQIGLEPVKINFETGGLEEAGKDAKTATKDFSQAASAISSVGSALQSIEDPGAKVAGIVAQAIATVASSFASALHTDGTTKSNIWAFIGAAAASTAAMVSMISTIHSSTGYAHGGIVKGNSYSGDNIAADSFVNAGELILSRSQQLAVASQLQNNSPLGGGRLVARLKGADLLLSIERELAVTGKGQLATFR